jgi:tetratricopeptide (TPR) repeat protein
MAANRCIVLLLALANLSPAQTSKPTVRRHHVAQDSDVSPQVAQAETAIDKRDYSAAEKLLDAATSAKPSDYRAWFDLGRVYGETQHKPQAIEAYRKSLAAKPDLFESNLNLGLLLAAAGEKKQAAQYLKAATGLKPSNAADAQPSLFNAWFAFARVQEADSPKEALDAYEHCAAISPKDFDVHYGEARLLEQQKQFEAAAAQYKQALEIDPSSGTAAAGLANSYMELKQLPQAEEALRNYLKLNPRSADAHLQLGRALATSGEFDQALLEYQSAQKLSPNDLRVSRELAGLAAVQKKYDQAEQQYSALVKADPQNADLHFALGTVLMDEHKFPESETELLAALKLNPGLADAYGTLATVAAENQHYPLVLKALDVRAQLLPENPGTYFLRASSYDHLKDYKRASENYHLFLDSDGGKAPNQEWQARHRLIAIEPKK